MTEKVPRAPAEGDDLRKYPEVVQYAVKYGMIKVGWTLADYLREAAQNQGYELLVIHGAQGSGKSTFALQGLNWIYQDWDTVLKSYVFHPKHFVDKLMSVPKGKRIPALLWDDLTVNFDSQKFKTDAELYGQIDSTFAAIRVKASVIIVTTPTMSRVPAVIRDHCTLEVFIGRNQMFFAERIFHSPEWKKLKSKLTKILIEGPRKFNMYDTPTPVFKKYYNDRLDLTEDTLRTLSTMTPANSTEGMISCWDLSELCSLSPNSIQSMSSRGSLPAGFKATKINDTLYFSEELIPKLAKKYPPGSTEKYA